MKIYSIIVTIIAVIAIIFAGIAYSEMSKVSDQAAAYQKENEKYKTDISRTEGELSELKGRMATLQKEASVLSAASSSFMIPGDLKALTVGSQEAAEIEKKIAGMTDKMERMVIEKDWNDFKSTLQLNAVLGLMRNLAQNIDRNLTQQPGNQAPAGQPIQQ